MPVCDVDRLIAHSASEVLETMFFSCVLGASDEAQVDPITTRLDFRGTPSGSFGLALSRPTARQIAAGFLAEDEQDITGTQIEEVICELTNMLCGSLLSRLESDSCFELNHPELAPVADHVTYSHNFEIESGTLRVWLNLNGTP